MKILQVHNQYLKPGGEDAVLEAERELLQSKGHTVIEFSTQNTQNDTVGLGAARAAGSNVWSVRRYREMRALLQDVSPDVVHIHNLFPQLGPSIYWAAKREGLPVIHTLHNYRLLCANALLVRENRPCELCVGSIPLPAIRHRCYRNSVAASSAMAASQMLHKAIGTYQNKIDRFIVLTEFARNLMMRGGLPSHKLVVVPNFSIPMDAPAKRSDEVLFLGRISPEKGLDVLIDAWEGLDQYGLLKIVGDGPVQSALQKKYSGRTQVEWKGRLPREDVVKSLRTAKVVVIPSRWYEGLPMVLIEAYAAGTPVIGPRHGPFPELISPVSDELLYEPGDKHDLHRVLKNSLVSNDWELWSDRVKQIHRDSFSPEAHYSSIMGIYRELSGAA